VNLSRRPSAQNCRGLARPLTPAVAISSHSLSASLKTVQKPSSVAPSPSASLSPWWCVALSAEPEPQIAEALQGISNSVSALVSEEIALAKAEVSAKVTTMGRGAGIGAAAGLFLIFALGLFAQTLAWGIYAIVGVGVWLGYLLATIIYLLLAAGAGMLAVKLFKSVQSPVPVQAIAEAQTTKQAVIDARRNA
jgi:hypothetical protein